MTDKNQYWEFVKCQIRTETIDNSIQRSKKLKKDEENLILKLATLEKKLDSNAKTDSPEYYEYIKTKGEWEKLVQRRTNGIISSIKSTMGRRRRKKYKILHKPREEKS